MAIEDKEEVEAKIKKEVARLKRNYSKIDAKRKSVTDGLVHRASFMRVQLEDLEVDILIHGLTEWFSQGEQDPYKRKRPEADLYNTMNTSYQKIIKQLTDLLPPDKPAPSEGGDGFDKFVSDRDD